LPEAPFGLDSHPHASGATQLDLVASTSLGQDG
jgi:hypothetical protein